MKDEFESTVSSYLNRTGPEGQDKLAEEFEVMASTTRRWADGTAKPGPAVQKLIIEWVRQHSD